MYKGRLDKVYAGILLAIFGGIVVHAPLSVGLSTLLPHDTLLIKSWKEILILIAATLLVAILYRKKQFGLLKDPILLLIGGYILLHILLSFYALHLGVSITSVAAGLCIDLRYVMYFGLVYICLSLYPDQRKNFFKIFMFGAVLVVVFALLQVFVLPADILKYIGYGPHTIEPYLTVDKNSAFVRINSTLRGPNSLGAYAVIVLGFIAAAIAKRKIPPMRQSKMMAAVLVVGSVVALWASYSRSALIAGIVAVMIAVTASLFKKAYVKIWVGVGVVLLVALGGFLVTHQNSSFVSNVLLHENPNGGSAVSSNDGHVTSLQQGVSRLVTQPLGAGIGSSGSASLLGDSPLIIENSYLFVAHETGWLGLGLFVAIFVMILARLWKARQSYVALGVFASGVGLVGIALLLPIWADDTIGIVWWGLAAVALAGAKK
jgi:hypothetical protein